MPVKKRLLGGCRDQELYNRDQDQEQVIAAWSCWWSYGYAPCWRSVVVRVRLRCVSFRLFFPTIIMLRWFYTLIFIVQHQDAGLVEVGGVEQLPSSSVEKHNRTASTSIDVDVKPHVSPSLVRSALLHIVCKHVPSGCFIFLSRTGGH